jgi:hypothetical protein
VGVGDPLAQGFTVGAGQIAAGSVVDATVAANAAIQESKLANITAGQVLMGNASNVPTGTSISGDVTITSAGIVTIGAGAIIDSKVAAGAAIAKSKISTTGTWVLADIPNGTGILKGTGGAPSYVTPILKADIPATTVYTDQTNTFGAFNQLFKDSNFQIVASADATKILTWLLSGMTTGTTLTIASNQTTAQTLTIPNITGADTLATLSLAQTFLAKKTFTTSLFQARDILDSNANKIIDLIAITSSVDWLEITDAATANPANILLSGKGSDTNIGLKFIPKGTGEAFGITETLVFPLGAESGNKAAGTYNTYFAPRAGQLIWAEQCATVAPTTSAVTLDIAKNGTTIFSTLPTIAAGATTGSNGVLTTTPTVIAKGDKLEFKVSINDTGATSAGIKLSIGLYRTA